MPRTHVFSPAVTTLLEAQDHVAATAQLTALGVSRRVIDGRVTRGQWGRLLQGVVLTTAGAPTRRQRLVAAACWAGPGSAIDGASACEWYGVRPETFDPEQVHVVTPFGSGLRTHSFVVVRRTIGVIPIRERGLVPYVDPATALVVAARSARSVREATALLSRGLQRNVVSAAELHAARRLLGDKWCGRLDAALVSVGIGLRSPAERDLHDLVLTSRVLPEPRWNCWLDLGDGGGAVCADALWVDAGLVHETNGRRYHAWGNDFDDMQARHDRLTACGLVALHNTPSRIRTAGATVLAELERTYLRHRGKGLPAGLRVLRAASDCA